MTDSWMSAMRRAVIASAEHLVQFAAGKTLRQFGEGSLLRHLARGAHEAGPCDARQRAADADPADAEIGCFRDRQTGRPDQEIDRPGAYGLHHRRYLLFGLDAGRIETIGAG